MTPTFEFELGGVPSTPTFEFELLLGGIVGGSIILFAHLFMGILSFLDAD
jgi:hypothetical protein